MSRVLSLTRGEPSVIYLGEPLPTHTIVLPSDPSP